MIIRKRPIINIKTSLENIPREWLVNVEPYIMRGQFLPCWLWMRSVDVAGYPTERMRDGKKMERRSMRRYVAKMFYDFPSEYYVTNIPSCRYKNCLNPAHLLPTADNPRWK
jgi:hypothetical protein